MLCRKELNIIDWEKFGLDLVKSELLTYANTPQYYLQHVPKGIF